MRDIIKLLRVKQWIKNFFVFGPIIFSKHLFDIQYVNAALLAFLSFCLLSSTIYIINDIVDLDIDKLHPIKKNRPITSGRISVPVAIIIAGVLFLIVVYINIFLEHYFQLVSLSYFILNILYTFWFKHIVILDVFSIAGGFMLRVLGGAIVINVPASPWLIICTLFISLFLAFAKRRSEIITMEDKQNSTTRKVLDDYDLKFLDIMLVITSSGMAISYSLYTVSERTIKELNTDNLIYTTIFVLYGIFRYLYLLLKKNIGEDTAQVLLKDTPMMINIFLWVITCIIILYRGYLLSQI
ncbi:MAG TPA: decaprenyl-phosphate phosphoribosyltransferase [Bacteroidota bacterium]|jgi:4-hydroxybenzoate polyprenyltransferase|nr:decaprenyl-phosphate phosphoribosyltransferase [Bacteroidota bacterium]